MTPYPLLIISFRFVLASPVVLSQHFDVSPVFFFNSEGLTILQQFTDVRLSFEILLDCLNIQLLFNLMFVFNQIAKTPLPVI